jgi:hypothetical protein
MDLPVTRRAKAMLLVGYPIARRRGAHPGGAPALSTAAGSHRAYPARPQRWAKTTS